MKNEESEWKEPRTTNANVQFVWRKDELASVWASLWKEGTFEAFIYKSTVSSKLLAEHYDFPTMEQAMHWADMYILTQGIKP
jgi:hypothetical protein